MKRLHRDHTNTQFLSNCGVIVAIIAVLIYLGASGFVPPDPRVSRQAITVTSKTRPTTDLFARGACRKFRNIAKQVNTGKVNFAEMRPLVKDVYTSAKFADAGLVPGLEAAANGMLREVSSPMPNLAAYSTAQDQFVTACQAPAAAE
jgi:hypothetical protein